MGPYAWITSNRLISCKILCLCSYLLFKKSSYIQGYGQALMRNATDAMKDSRVHDYLASVCASTFISFGLRSTLHPNYKTVVFK